MAIVIHNPQLDFVPNVKNMLYVLGYDFIHYLNTTEEEFLKSWYTLLHLIYADRKKRNPIIATWDWFICNTLKKKKA